MQNSMIFLAGKYKFETEEKLHKKSKGKMKSVSKAIEGMPKDNYMSRSIVERKKELLLKTGKFDDYKKEHGVKDPNEEKDKKPKTISKEIYKQMRRSNEKNNKGTGKGNEILLNVR